VGQQNITQKVLAWVLSVAVLGLITLNGWLVQTVMAHSKDIAVLSTGVQGRLDAIVTEQSRLARAQEESTKQLQEINATMLRHISKTEVGENQYGNQVKQKTGW